MATTEYEVEQITDEASVMIPYTKSREIGGLVSD